MMKYILDRFEANVALLEPTEGERGMQTVPRVELPAEAREGDVLCRAGENWQVDRLATCARRERLRRRFSGLTGNHD